MIIKSKFFNSNDNNLKPTISDSKRMDVGSNDEINEYT